jgi:hypothetical protein
MHAIIAAEFFHWAKTSPAAAALRTGPGASLSIQPTPDNTLFSVDPSSPELQLQPPQSSTAVPPGHVAQPSDAPGWSLFDVQAAVPAAEVVSELQRLADQPLVYVGHPVMVVPSTPGAKAVGTTEQERAADRALYGSPHQEPSYVWNSSAGSDVGGGADELLAHINAHLGQAHCKAVWVSACVRARCWVQRPRHQCSA